MEVNTLTNLDLVFDDSWSVYESYLADYCPQNVQPFPSGGGGSDGKLGRWSAGRGFDTAVVLLRSTL